MSPEHDSNASPSANNEVKQEAGENSANSANMQTSGAAGATPAVSTQETHSHAASATAGATASSISSGSRAATAVVRAPEVAAAPTPKPEPPCETRTEVTETEAHRENVHPSDDAKENQKPTHAVPPRNNPAHKGEAMASSDGARDHDANSALAQASEATSPDGRAMSVSVPVASSEPVVEGDPAFAGAAKAAGAATDGEVHARTSDAHATHPQAEGAAATAPAEAHVAPTAENPAVAESHEMESNETMEQLLEQFPTPEPVAAEGEIFDGRVVSVTEAGVVVDVGGKFEGLVPAQEFADSGSPIEFGPGQTIEVERLHESKDGYVLLSHVRAHRRRVWERIDKAYREHATVKGKVTERIKGGLVVDIGVRSFLPASQIELRPVHDLDSWKDRDLEVRVLKLNRKRGNVVVSRRAILEEEQKAKRSALVEALHEGSVVTGKVKNVTDYGVFVDLGGMDGLLHVSDLVWGRVPHPSTIVKAGDDLEVQVLKFDKEKQRISLGRKQLLPDPWATVPERFPVGMKLTGKVVGVTDYGAFVQIEPGVEGLVHVSEMSWSKRTKHPSKVVKTGDDIDVVVLEVKTDQRRISLGLKQTQPDPWEAAAEKYPVGTIVHGKIRNLADFGAFVEIEEGMEGLIHISDVSWTERIKHPSDKFKKGDNVEAKVLKVDSANRRLSLGIKQVKDIWSDWFSAHKVGEVIKGKVARTTDFGAFVTLAEGIEGLCHISEIEERRPKGDRGDRDKDREAKEKMARGARVTAVLTVGTEYDFKVLRLEPESRKISLSYRAAQKQQERQEIETFKSTAKVAKSSPTATIGDMIMAKRQAK
jgi:small subunit ribosomal protein S1